jgi:hypothetical protein
MIVVSLMNPGRSCCSPYFLPPSSGALKMQRKQCGAMPPLHEEKGNIHAISQSHSMAVVTAFQRNVRYRTLMIEAR